METGVVPRSIDAFGRALALGAAVSAALWAASSTDLREPPRPAAEYLAAGYALNDLEERGAYLAEEIRRLAEDTDLLWSQWGNYVGVRGSWADWLSPAPPASTASGRMHAYKLQTDLFRHRSRALGQRERIEDSQRRLREAAGGWDTLGAWLERDLTESGDGRRLIGAVAQMRQDLSKAAARLNALDQDVRVLQQDLDDAYVQLQRYFHENLAEPPALPRPWHWEYLLSGRPRPELQYDFDARFEEHLDRARRQLAGETPARPERLAPPSRRLPTLSRRAV